MEGEDNPGQLVSWQRGFIILIPKSSTTDLNEPSEFRRIALLNAEGTEGRSFFTLVEWKLSDYMISNGYIKSQIQRGFMREVAGCRSVVPPTWC